jgi:hypothetical protein
MYSLNQIVYCPHRNDKVKFSSDCLTTGGVTPPLELATPNFELSVDVPADS